MMYSVAIFVALITITNAIGCKPLTCMLACPYGFEINAEGCPICNCRVTPNICVGAIEGYTCGLLEGRNCPSTHECQLGFTGFSGQCCLKQTGSSTVPSRSTGPLFATGTSTTTTRRTTTKPLTTTKTTTRRTSTTTTRRTSTTTRRSSTTRRMF